MMIHVNDHLDRGNDEMTFLDETSRIMGNEKIIINTLRKLYMVEKMSRAWSTNNFHKQYLIVIYILN